MRAKQNFPQGLNLQEVRQFQNLNHSKNFHAKAQRRKEKLKKQPFGSK